jgi:antitoxin (DNA-binding transcriptional repressor) of toxin-antitoxin stability system
MKAIGVKQLKARLSEYFRLVKGGETILVTERNDVAAELRPARRHLRPAEASMTSSMQRDGSAGLSRHICGAACGPEAGTTPDVEARIREAQPSCWHAAGWKVWNCSAPTIACATRRASSSSTHSPSIALSAAMIAIPPRNGR